MNNKKLKRILISSIALFFIFVSYGVYNMVYNHYSLPILKFEDHHEIVKINETEYAIQQMTYNGSTYKSEPLATEDQFLQGKQVGRTEDGLQIYEVKDNHQYLILKGFMFPGIVFKKVSP